MDQMFSLLWCLWKHNTIIGIDLFNLPLIDIYYKLVVVLSEIFGVKVYQATIGNFPPLILGTALVSGVILRFRFNI